MPERDESGSKMHWLTLGFGITIAMWAVGYFCRLPPAVVPPPLVLWGMLACLFLGGLVAGRHARVSIGGAAVIGAISALLNLLILGSLLGAENASDIVPTAAIWAPGSILLSSVLVILGALIGRLAPGRRLAPDDWRNGFALVATVATLLLLIAGGLVTSMDAGLAVPDWPNSFGSNMFLYPLSKMTGGIYYEHAHRLYGSLVGLTTVALAVSLWQWNSTRRRDWLLPLIAVIVTLLVTFTAAYAWQPAGAEHLESARWTLLIVASVLWVGCYVWAARSGTRRWLRGLALLAILAVTLQGVMGGLRVTEADVAAMGIESSRPEDETFMSAALGIAHGVFGQVFFVLVGLLWAFSTRTWRSSTRAEPKPSAAMDYAVSRALVIIILLQLVLGAAYRHLATPEDPLPWTGILHLTVAGLIAVLSLLAGLRAWALYPDHRMLRRFGALLMALVLLQLLLGLGALIMIMLRGEKPSAVEVLFATAHQANGVLVFAVAAQLAAWTRRLLTVTSTARVVTA